MRRAITSYVSANLSQSGRKFGRRRTLLPELSLTSVLHLRRIFFHSCNMASNEAANGDDWEKAEGVPSLSEPFIQKYLSGRDALIQQEKKQRSGWWPRREQFAR